MTEGFTLLVGDVREQLATLPDESVHCVVTSPPYWGLRDYGTGSWEGGDPECDHLGAPFRTKSKINANCGTGVDGKNAEDREPMGQTCSKCGASRVDRQIGLEGTPDEFVQAMVEVFREVRRVLRADGTLWLNLGDSYASSPPGNTKTGVEKWASSGLHGGVSPKYAALCEKRVATWYKKPTRGRDEPVEGQVSIFDALTEA